MPLIWKLPFSSATVIIFARGLFIVVICTWTSALGMDPYQPRLLLKNRTLPFRVMNPAFCEAIMLLPTYTLLTGLTLFQLRDHSSSFNIDDTMKPETSNWGLRVSTSTCSKSFRGDPMYL